MTASECARRRLPDCPTRPTSEAISLQFRAMCATLGGLVIAPLGSVSFGDEWREREQDLRQLVREATDHFMPPGSRWPMSSEVGYEHRRYIPGYLSDGTVDNGANCSVGIGTRFADEGQTPFWLRYHRRTPDFGLVKARLSRSSYSPRLRTDDRHVWVPLDARPDAAGPELVRDLVAQISSILATASTGYPASRLGCRSSTGRFCPTGDRAVGRSDSKVPQLV
jgi:hypothetical protein